MKVHFDKKEKKGLFGTSYVLEAKIDLTPEEQAAHKETGAFRIIEEHVLDSFSPSVDKIKVMRGGTLSTSLAKGFKMKFSNLRDLAMYQEAFVEGCRGLKNALDVHLINKVGLGGSTTIDL